MCWGLSKPAVRWKLQPSTHGRGFVHHSQPCRAHRAMTILMPFSAVQSQLGWHLCLQDGLTPPDILSPHSRATSACAL